MGRNTSEDIEDERRNDARPFVIRSGVRVLYAFATLLLVVALLIIVWPYLMSLLILFAESLQQMLRSLSPTW